MRWDLFCHVVDNFGDIGVCWRLAADLASRGEHVRLWIDDASALAWMAPGGAEGVTVLNWNATDAVFDPGDVVIEAFGCDPPAPFVRHMAERTSPPVWINLEYLSAEPVAERNHGLPSPQLGGPGQGLTKWFFYPGFAAGTGGLIRETWLEGAQRGFDATDWLRRHGLDCHDGEQMVSLFCYANPAAPALLEALANAPTLLLVTPGPAEQQVTRTLGPALTRGALRAVVLPYLTQRDFDALLWTCDLNFVRGEDSFVRAQWAGKPFVWQIYPQHDGAHHEKLDAFLALHLEGADSELADHLQSLWRIWNGLSSSTLGAIAHPRWRRHCEAWRGRLQLQPDLTQQLLWFASERR